MMSSRAEIHKCRALVLTAIPAEYAAVRSHLKRLREERAHGSIYEMGLFRGLAGRVWEVLIAETGAGNLAAASEAQRAILHFEPNVLIFVGVAGGIKDVRLCDVVAATKVYGYESGKAVKRFLPRPNVGLTSYSLIQSARAEARRSRWRKRLRGYPRSIAPHVYVAPIAAGEKVIASRRSTIFQFLREHYSDAIAVEMEGRGVLQAAHSNEHVSAIVVRGISDLIASKSRTDAQGCQELAAKTASAFAFQVLAASEPRALQRKEPRHRQTALTHGVTGRWISLERLPDTSPSVFGRKHELDLLDRSWNEKSTGIVCCVAWGGVGKSALVNEWLLRRMAPRHYGGAQKVFGWSFYSQGTRDDASSADVFLATAVRWFGDRGRRALPPEQKGARLAELVRQQRTLLILDGLEPLQDPTQHNLGRLKHPGIRRLLQELAKQNPGLCVLSSRLPVTDLSKWVDTSLVQLDLDNLSPTAGRQVLELNGARGRKDELEKASKEYAGHALALTILGHYLSMAANGDIRRRDRIGPLIYDAKLGGHARRVLQAYTRWLRRRPAYRVELDSLRMVGLFDRPVDYDTWRALAQPPAISGITDHVSRVGEDRWRYALGVLRTFGLLSKRDPTAPDAIDCHPLVREHFGEELQRTARKGWVQAHKRLFLALRPKTTRPPRDIEEMAPYYQAIAHGCRAGLHCAAFRTIYVPFIRQGNAYNTETLRAFADDYAALRCFLQNDRSKVVPALRQYSGFILGELGFDLRTLGRVDEAIEFMRSALEWDKAQPHRDHRINAARQADLLSTTQLIRGFVRDAIALADEAIALARGDDYHTLICLTTRADARHHAGDLQGAGCDFRLAETIARRTFPQWRYLRSFQGCRYCNYLLTCGRPEEAMTRLRMALIWDKDGGYPRPQSSRVVHLHALQTEGRVLPLALDHLMCARTLLMTSNSRRHVQTAKLHIDEALAGIDASATRHLKPLALLIWGQWLRAAGDAQAARDTLMECIALCESDNIRLYLTDCHVELARLP